MVGVRRVAEDYPRSGQTLYMQVLVMNLQSFFLKGNIQKSCLERHTVPYSVP